MQERLRGIEIGLEIWPGLVKPGHCLIIHPQASGMPATLLAFNSKEERDAWLDSIDEKIFDLNHPVRK